MLRDPAAARRLRRAQSTSDSAETSVRQRRPTSHPPSSRRTKSQIRPHRRVTRSRSPAPRPSATTPRNAARHSRTRFACNASKRRTPHFPRTEADLDRLRGNTALVLQTFRSIRRSSNGHAADRPRPHKASRSEHMNWDRIEGNWKQFSGKVRAAVGQAHGRRPRRDRRPSRGARRPHPGSLRRHQGRGGTADRAVRGTLDSGTSDMRTDRRTLRSSN